jgi:hypothetical protein
MTKILLPELYFQPDLGFHAFGLNNLSKELNEGVQASSISKIFSAVGEKNLAINGV